MLRDVDKIHQSIVAEGDSFAVLPKAYGRSNGLVHVFFGSRPDGLIRRSQAAQIINAVKLSYLSYGLREILVSEITLVNIAVATFALRFNEAGNQS